MAACGNAVGRGSLWQCNRWQSAVAVSWCHAHAAPHLRGVGAAEDAANVVDGDVGRDVVVGGERDHAAGTRLEAHDAEDRRERIEVESEGVEAASDDARACGTIRSRWQSVAVGGKSAASRRQSAAVGGSRRQSEEVGGSRRQSAAVGGIPWLDCAKRGNGFPQKRGSGCGSGRGRLRARRPPESWLAPAMKLSASEKVQPTPTRSHSPVSMMAVGA